ncbi:hypothetical protein FSPOR_8754 [Fusarium sporotrichioides]|uniref:Uncharacterized protein n=1 Tax=Fusarium sporotrichioides TaxID=5514 RepID=A0A395RTK3_FUSSP|nr:hypothetical protein FSPOR_8754 [Fusarium sporotrichioides]
MNPLDEFYSEANGWLKNGLDLINTDRGIAVWFMNNTDQELTWSDSGVDHGERSQLAPDTIAPRTWGRWALQSCGFQTGCEGWMTWTFSDGTKVELGYDNPYYGSNSYSCSVNSTSYTVSREGGDGNIATIKFIVGQN